MSVHERTSNAPLVPFSRPRVGLQPGSFDRLEDRLRPRTCVFQKGTEKKSRNTVDGRMSLPPPLLNIQLGACPLSTYKPRLPHAFHSHSHVHVFPPSYLPPEFVYPAVKTWCILALATWSAFTTDIVTPSLSESLYTYPPAPYAARKLTTQDGRSQHQAEQWR